ncbi:hypothetical protein AKJ64_02600 [candidate division MSBL1 archaeon SCGC-AAA259E17]|uniref:NurA domain-containing protein n=2 Tax=candidate division MSBL1 TaxID=215777 RepID=A0A133UEY7_9EURY|nr:hypothetical protein AKJ64_02600 [candidate division MSBL1 archaeon SCGC-AAA259E17]
MISASKDSISLSEQQHLEDKIGKIAEKIRAQGEKRRLLAKVIREAKKDFKLPVDDEKLQLVESEMVYKVGKAPLEDLTIGGVDGGVLNKPLHGLDLILVRAIAAIFSYEDGELVSADYHPNEMPIPQLINVHEPLNSRELDVLVGMKRQLKELKVAEEALEAPNIDALMLDGSIVPQYTDHSSGARLRELYKEITDSFTDLYRKCRNRDVLLLGAVKDSRSARLVKIFRNKIFSKVLENADLPEAGVSSLDENKDVLTVSRDTAFLDYLLEAGERSFTFAYADAPAHLLEDLKDWKNKIFAFYVKPVSYDRPARVEFVADPKQVSEKAGRAASLINSLSADHEACALPSVLIEADARAALPEEEISILRDNIADRLEPSTMLDLRRERRPF